MRRCVPSRVTLARGISGFHILRPTMHLMLERSCNRMLDWLNALLCSLLPDCGCLRK